MESRKKRKCERLMYRKKVEFVWSLALAWGLKGEFLTVEEFVQKVDEWSRSAVNSAVGSIVEGS